MEVAAKTGRRRTKRTRKGNTTAFQEQAGSTIRTTLTRPNVCAATRAGGNKEEEWEKKFIASPGEVVGDKPRSQHKSWDIPRSPSKKWRRDDGDQTRQAGNICSYQKRRPRYRRRSRKARRTLTKKCNWATGSARRNGRKPEHSTPEQV